MQAGAITSYALRADGTIWSWGGDGTALGNGTNNYLQTGPSLVSVTGARDLVTSAGGSALAILSDGSLWSWGRNYRGELGDGTTVNRTEPVHVPLDDVVSASHGADHTIAVDGGGAVWAWGDNTQGATRPGDPAASYSSPQPVLSGGAGPSAAGFQSSVVAVADAAGSAVSWGANANGELGQGTVNSNANPAGQVSGLSGVVDVGAGQYFQTALLGDGSVRTWGSTQAGQLGIGYASGVRPTPQVVPELGQVIMLSTGPDYVLAVLADGTLRGWGNDWNSQLGVGQTYDGPRWSPVQVHVSGIALPTTCGGARTTAPQQARAARIDQAHPTKPPTRADLVRRSRAAAGKLRVRTGIPAKASSPAAGGA